VTLYRRSVTEHLFHGLFHLDFEAVLKTIAHDRMSGSDESLDSREHLPANGIDGA